MNQNWNNLFDGDFGRGGVGRDDVNLARETNFKFQ